MNKFASAATELVLAVALLLLCNGGGGARAQTLPPIQPRRETASSNSLELQLEVYVNGASSHQIATFRQIAGRLLIEPEQLRNVGIEPSKEATCPDGLIDLSRLTGVSFNYDIASQTVYFVASESKRAARLIDAQNLDGDISGDRPQVSTPKSGFGGLVNYSVYAASGGQNWDGLRQFQGVSGVMEGRLFGAYGILTSSQLVRSSDAEKFGFTRLDTQWSYSDPEALISSNVGDIITGALSWTRPARLGGIQIRRNFKLRPDLVTMPLPEFSGSAAVPSTVDIYVDKTHSVSTPIDEGPFSITNLPVVTGAGTARMVVRDVLGRETVTETPFYASSELLAPSLVDYSVDVGFARRYYGVESDEYDHDPVGSGSFRYGVSRQLTVEGHAEAAAHFYNAGLGSLFNIGSYGVAAVAGAYSRFGDEVGYQVTASVEAELSAFKFYLRMQRSFADFNDIASITSQVSEQDIPIRNARPAIEIDQLSVSPPELFQGTSLNFSYARVLTQDAVSSNLVQGTATRALGGRGNLFVSAYTDLKQRHSFGMFAGLSWSLGRDITLSTSVSSDADGTNATTEIVKSDQPDVGATAWRVRGTVGQQRVGSALGSYRGSAGRIEAGVEKYNDDVRASAQIEGAVVVADRDVFLSNRIDDALAVVDAGASDVEVQFENRSMGKTGRSGKLLLPNLRSYDKNSISIDPSNLPLDAIVNETRQVVNPTDRGEALVDFNVRTDARTLLVTLRDQTGAYIAVGSLARLNGSQDFVVGYDGQVYLQGVASENRLAVTQQGTGACLTEFSAPKDSGEPSVLPELACRSEK